MKKIYHSAIIVFLVSLSFGSIACHKSNKPAANHPYNLNKSTVTIFPKSNQPQKGLFMRYKSDHLIPKGSSAHFILMNKNILNAIKSKPFQISFEKMGCKESEIWNIKTKLIKTEENYPVCAINFSKVLSKRGILPCGYGGDYVLFDELIQSQKIQNEVLQYLDVDVQKTKDCMEFLKSFVDTEFPGHPKLRYH